MGISRQQASDCFASDDLIGIGMEADAVRRSLHPEGVVCYALDPTIDLSTAPEDTLFALIAQAIDQAATGISLRNPPSCDIAWFETPFRAIKQRFPQIKLNALTAPNILSIAELSSLSIPQTLTRLRDAGLDSLQGEGAQTLGLARWLEIHRAAHLCGIPSTALMTFGAGESTQDRVAFLEAINALQQETHGFHAFTLTSFHSPNGRDLDDPTAVEYLKTLAICRMVLDSIPHIQVDWQQQGLKVLQMALRFGGNDAGSLHGPSSSASEEEIRRVIRDAGFKPAQRDTLYRTLFLI